MCVLYNASGKNCLPADERHSYTGSETSVGDVIHTVLRSDDKVFKFVLGNNSESDLKQEMMVDEMEDLMEDQVWDGLGFCL